MNENYFDNGLSVENATTVWVTLFRYGFIEKCSFWDFLWWVGGERRRNGKLQPDTIKWTANAVEFAFFAKLLTEKLYGKSANTRLKPFKTMFNLSDDSYQALIRNFLSVKDFDPYQIEEPNEAERRYLSLAKMMRV